MHVCLPRDDVDLSLSSSCCHPAVHTSSHLRLKREPAVFRKISAHGSDGCGLIKLIKLIKLMGPTVAASLSSLSSLSSWVRRLRPDEPRRRGGLADEQRRYRRRQPSGKVMTLVGLEGLYGLHAQLAEDHSHQLVG